jgi:hypothetical protein
MNFDNINKVIDWLEQGAPEFVFSMRYGLTKVEETDLLDEDDDQYETLAMSQKEKLDAGCGSVCCIGGAAAQFDGMKPGDQYEGWWDIQTRALKYFGIPFDEHTPWMLAVFDPDCAPEQTGPKAAAKALKRWADHVAQNPTDINFNPWDNTDE